MTTRKLFLRSALSVGLLAAAAHNPAAAATATPAPKPTPTPLTKPGPAARALAASLQQTLVRAKLSDATTQLVASDIQDGFAINEAFRNRSHANLPPPDFVFTATDADQP
jgi:hypothetical protein